MKKIKTVGTIGEFMQSKREQEARQFTSKLSKIVGTTLPLTLLPTIPAFAQEVGVQQAGVIGDKTRELIVHSFDPLIDLVQALSYPIAGVMLAGGCLFIMCGFKERGMDMLKNAAIGYILVQLSPLFLKLLVQVGATVV